MQLLHGAQIGVWRLNVPARTVIRNAYWTELLGCTEEDERVDPLVGWMRRMHPDDLNVVRQTRERLLRGEIDHYWCEFRLKRNEGNWVHLRGYVQSLERDAHGAAVRTGGIIFDVSRERERDKRLHALFDRPFQYVGLLKPDGTVLESSRASLRAFGAKLEDLIGRKFWETAIFSRNPEVIPTVRNCVERAAAGEEGVRSELVRRDENGALRYVDFTMTPIRDQDGHVFELIPEARDITDVVRMRSELLQTSERLQTATVCAEIGLWDFDPRTDRTWLSPEAVAMLDLPRGVSTFGRSDLMPLFHPEDEVVATQKMQELLIGAVDELRTEARMRNAEGQWRWILLRGRIVERDERQRPLRVVGVQMDVSERHEMEVQLAAAQRLEALGQLAAGVSHEINTPVQYVNDSVYFIRDATLDLMRCLESMQAGRPLSGDDQENLVFLRENLPLALTRAMDGLGRVSEIVRSMKEFAHPDRHDMAPVDINQAVQSTLIVARNEYKHVARIELDLGALPPVQCHGGEINQVLLNLIVNAAHAIAAVVGDSGRLGVIRIRTRIEHGEAVLTVADSGCGIPGPIQSRVFEPFFTTKGVGYGTGQGLAIARQLIVSRHGGRISFTSEQGKGTTFIVAIPVAGRSANGAVAA